MRARGFNVYDADILLTSEIFEGGDEDYDLLPHLHLPPIVSTFKTRSRISFFVDKRVLENVAVTFTLGKGSFPPTGTVVRCLRSDKHFRSNTLSLTSDAEEGGEGWKETLVVIGRKRNELRHVPNYMFTTATSCRLHPAAPFMPSAFDGLMLAVIPCS